MILHFNTALKDMPFRLGRATAVLLFGLAIQHYIIILFGLAPFLLWYEVAPITTAISLIIIAATLAMLIAPASALRPSRQRPSSGIVTMAIIATILTLPSIFLLRSFGLDDFETVLMSVTSNNTSQMLMLGLADFSGLIIDEVAIFAIAIASASILRRTLAGFQPFAVMLLTAAIAMSTPVRYVYSRILPDPAGALVAVDDLVPPIIIGSPDVPPNLVLLYLESLERTYRNIPATAAAFAPLAEIEDRGYSADNIAQIHNTHYSIAGVVATQCGIPLFSRGLINMHAPDGAEMNRRYADDSFLPNVICLGDILSDLGYRGVYMKVTDGSEYSFRDILLAHGYDSVRGLSGEPKFAAHARDNSWGTSDAVLFRAVRDELHHLDEAGQPFFLSLLNIATHGPYGFPDDDCAFTASVPTVDPNSRMPRTIRCTADHVVSLLDEIATLKSAENTIVVIVSDHLAMMSTLDAELDEAGDTRRNLFVVLNGDGSGEATVTSRQATPLDIYPTILQAMGFTPQDGKANLGRSLLSDGPTLAEALGVNMLDRALSTNRDIANYVWQTTAPPDDSRLAALRP